MIAAHFAAVPSCAPAAVAVSAWVHLFRHSGNATSRPRAAARIAAANDRVPHGEEASIPRRATAWVLLIGFRIITALAFAAGVGALVAGVVMITMASRSDADWAASLSRFALALGGVLVVACAVASRLMPARTALVRDIRGEPDHSLPPMLTLLLVGLCGAAALQTPAVLTWWMTDRSLLRVLTIEGPDPLGLNLVPAAILFSMPLIAAATLLSGVLIATLTIIAPAGLSTRVLAAGVVLQTGLIVGGFLLVREVHGVGTSILAWLTGPDLAEATAAVQEWIGRHDTAAAAAHRPLPWILCGYAVALALSLALPRTVRESSATPLPVPTEPGNADTERVAHSWPISTAAAAFEDTMYSVRPRMTMLESLFIRKHSNYDIQTVPKRSRLQFSFSWTSGILRQEPGGPDLLTITPARPPNLFTSHSYAIAETATGECLANLLPAGADWEIVHPSGDAIARVLRETAGRGFAKYVAMIEQHEVCRFKWALHGLSVMSAELEVDCAGDGPARLDRALAIALAPILEQQARMTSERARSS